MSAVHFNGAGRAAGDTVTITMSVDDEPRERDG